MERQPLFGQFLIHEGIISEETLKSILDAQSEINHSYATLAIEKNLVSIEDVRTAYRYQLDHGISFKEALIALGIFDYDKLWIMDAAIKENTFKLGEILVKRGLITKEGLSPLIRQYELKVRHKDPLRNRSLYMFAKTVEEQEDLS